MAPKPKPKDDGQPDTFADFTKLYNKGLKEFDAPKIGEVQEIMTKTEEEGQVDSWNFSREFDPMAFRILWDSLRQAKHEKIKAIRLWKCCRAPTEEEPHSPGDESVRVVCNYLNMQPTPEVCDLHFTDNGVTELGCEFLGRTLGPHGNKTINLLNLDFNQFGTRGVEKLSAGLSQNSTLRSLSLRYCGIGEDGGQFIAHILMFQACALQILELTGNYLQEQGTLAVLGGCRRNKSLMSLTLFDNKFSDTPEVVEAFRDLFRDNTKLEEYNLAGNAISDAGAHQLVQGMVGMNHLKKVYVPDRCSAKTWEALEMTLGGGKGKKGKKGKKKK